MATSKTFGQLAKRINVRTRQVTSGSERAVRRAALAADAELVGRTPVDKGRAKGNWIAAVGSPSSEQLSIEGPNTGEAALNQARSVVGRWRLGAGPIFLTNNLAYIVPLDNGSSAQAPAGMSQFALQAARNELRKAKLLR